MDDKNAETITGMWKIAGESTEFIGVLHLGDKPSLQLPMLPAPNSVPYRSKVFHGRAPDLKRYTALTLPARHSGSVGRPGVEINYNMDLRVLTVLVGDEFVENPEQLLVSEISFEPAPNEALHASSLYEYLSPTKDILKIEFAQGVEDSIKKLPSAYMAYFAVDQTNLVQVEIPSLGLVKAHLVGTMRSDGGTRAAVCFTLHFQTPLSLRAAEQEVHKLCAFLSFLSHGFVTPVRLGILTADDARFGVVAPRYRGAAEAAPNSHPIYSLARPDDDAVEFGRILRGWYETNADLLRSRFLYRWSLAEPLSFSYERFLSVFNAIDGLLKATRARNKAAYSEKLLTAEELSSAIDAVVGAVPPSERRDLFLGGMRNANSVSPREAFLKEISSLLDSIGAVPEEGDVPTFVQRVFNRRNRMAHGGRGVRDELTDPLLTLDTMILTAIYAMLDARIIGIDPLDAGMALGSAYAWKPLKYDVPAVTREDRLKQAWVIASTKAGDK